MSTPAVVKLGENCSLVGKIERLSTAECVEACKEDIEKHNRDIYTFLGVPFAAPPVGDLRFKDPQPLPLWKGERKALEYGPVCPQTFDILKGFFFELKLPEKISEDCLYLNVFTPSLDNAANLPVMVWIHGGGFISGFPSIYPGNALVTFHDVIFVTVAYRVGIFGFVCTGDDEAPGNYGLLDQIEALKWVQKHIRQFGGDPDNVTVFGESAGGISVSLLAASPLSNGLFRNVISESGSPSTLGLLHEPSTGRAVTNKFLEQYKITATDSKEILKELRAMPEDKLVLPLPFYLTSSLNPVIDGKFLTARPEDVYSSGQQQKVNYLMGCNRNEGAFMLYSMCKMLGQPITNSLTPQSEGLLKLAIVQHFPKSNPDKIFEEVKKRYFQDGTESEAFKKAYCELFGDLCFVIPLIMLAEDHCARCPTYVYEFSYKCGFNKDLPDWVRADHGMDVPFVLGFGCLRNDIIMSSDDWELSKRMMKYWTNFAKTGDPNGADLPSWPAYNSKQKLHLQIDKEITTESKLKEERRKFWIDIVPTLV